MFYRGSYFLLEHNIDLTAQTLMHKKCFDLILHTCRESVLE